VETFCLRHNTAQIRNQLITEMTDSDSDAASSHHSTDDTALPTAPPCNFSLPAKCSPGSSLGKATKASELRACQTGCPRIYCINTGDIFIRQTGKKVTAAQIAQGCPHAPRPRAKRPPKPHPDAPAREAARTAKDADASTTAAKAAKTAGLTPEQVKSLPSKLTPSQWRVIFDLIRAPSNTDRRAAATAVAALHAAKGTGDGAGAGMASSAAEAARADEKWEDLLRMTVPYERADIIPIAATVAAYCAAVDHNAAAAAAKTPLLTITPDKLRHGATGPPIPISDAMGVQLAKVFLDEGKIWFRDLVKVLARNRAGDPVHYVKTRGKPAEALLLVWPYRWAYVRLKSWRLHVAEIDMDADIPGLMNQLREDVDLNTQINPLAHNFAPCLIQAGCLRKAAASDPISTTTHRPMRALTRLVTHDAEEFYRTGIDTKGGGAAYAKAIEAGARLIGVPSAATDTEPKTPHAATAGAPATPRGRGARGGKKGSKGGTPATTQPTPAPAIPSPAAGPAVVHVQSATATGALAQQPSPSAILAATPKFDPGATAAAGTAAAPRPRLQNTSGTMFTDCRGVGCSRGPPSPSPFPFCRTCAPTHEYNFTTNTATRKTDGATRR
jgi:hypothetical protein